VQDGVSFGKTLQTALTANQVDPSKVGVLMKGSVPPILSGNFTYTSTTSSITISWTNLVVYRADGTFTIIANGSQTITGLAAGTTYYFYPYYNEVSEVLNFVSNSNLVNPSPDITGATFNATAVPLGYVSTTTSLTRPTSVSCELWFRTTLTTTGITFLEMSSNQTGSGGTTDFICAYASPGRVAFTPGTSNIAGGTNVNDGLWHYFVGTYNGTTAFAYVDGVQVATGAVTASGSFAGYWRISQDDSTGYPSNPTIALAAIYSGIVLTATQVAAHYNQMKLAGTAGYVSIVTQDGATALWELNETSGTTATDSIGTNTGTYQPTVTLNQSAAVYQGAGSPAIAWEAPFLQGQQAQSLQGNMPLSAGSMSAATTASGSGGGTTGGATGSGGGGQKYIQ